MNPWTGISKLAGGLAEHTQWLTTNGAGQECSRELETENASLPVVPALVGEQDLDARRLTSNGGDEGLDGPGIQTTHCSTWNIKTTAEVNGQLHARNISIDSFIV